jgi:GTPase SAR1 family protein
VDRGFSDPEVAGEFIVTNAVYLLGAPGVGKSSVMRVLLNPWKASDYVRFTDREMFGHYLHEPARDLHGAYLGHLRPEFPGTDALSMSVQPQALKWLRQNDGELDYIYGEGARLGNFAFLSELAYRSHLTVVHITASPETRELRMLGRPDAANHKTGRTGRAQDPTWQDAQATRNRNLYHRLVELCMARTNLEVLSIDNTDLDAEQTALSILGAMK